ncbi:hypothetical protein [Nonomuraea diastatica]|uniref:Uncharacterized protein n=1 Tax=Nonomuraea diastatica TaxID=1848329 RepID=A0A4R4WNU3_9ACTN|nr:hypothetical protein [Nonomuraea diastatica]TDD18714.1 hypothetical protein E1294_23455 [Nonomuraea diastatica]
MTLADAALGHVGDLPEGGSHADVTAAADRVITTRRTGDALRAWLARTPPAEHDGPHRLAVTTDE